MADPSPPREIAPKAPQAAQPDAAGLSVSPPLTAVKSSKSKKDNKTPKKSQADKEKKQAKEKKKLIVACIGCRKKKIKCSSDRPACSNCLRLNIPCEYPVIRNRGSRFGYMEMLNRRMQHLEKYINCSSNPQYHPQFVTIHQKSRMTAQSTVAGQLPGSANSGYTNFNSNVSTYIPSGPFVCLLWSFTNPQ